MRLNRILYHNLIYRHHDVVFYLYQWKYLLSSDFVLFLKYQYSSCYAHHLLILCFFIASSVIQCNNIGVNVINFLNKFIINYEP